MKNLTDKYFKFNLGEYAANLGYKRLSYIKILGRVERPPNQNMTLWWYVESYASGSGLCLHDCSDHRECRQLLSEYPGYYICNITQINLLSSYKEVSKLEGMMGVGL
jgi:hypothetical protein